MYVCMYVLTNTETDRGTIKNWIFGLLWLAEWNIYMYVCLTDDTAGHWSLHTHTHSKHVFTNTCGKLAIASPPAFSNTAFNSFIGVPHKHIYMLEVVGLHSPSQDHTEKLSSGNNNCFFIYTYMYCILRLLCTSWQNAFTAIKSLLMLFNSLDC